METHMGFMYVITYRIYKVKTERFSTFDKEHAEKTWERLEGNPAMKDLKRNW